MKFRKFTALIITVALVLGVFFFLRSPQVTNGLKRLASNEFEAATGYQIIFDSLYVNLFPLYAKAKNVVVFDSRARKVFAAGSIKAYPGLLGLLEKTVLIRRVVVERPELHVDPPRLDDFSAIAAGKHMGKGFKLKIQSLEIADGNVSYVDAARGISIAASGLQGQALLDGRKDFKISSDVLRADILGVPPLQVKLKDLYASLRGAAIDIKHLSAEVAGSSIDAAGGYSPVDGLALRADLKVLPESAKELFNLKGPGGGALFVKARVKARDIKDLQDAFVNARVTGDFPAETLMEALKTGVDARGMAHIEATLKGQAGNLSGSGTGRAEKCSIYGLQAKRLGFNVDYSSGVLSFKDVKAEIYEGRAAGDATVRLAGGGGFFSLNFAFSGVRNKPFLTGFLKLDLPIPEGRLSGKLFSSGKIFEPVGSFLDETTLAGADFLGRIKTIASGYSLIGNTLTLSGAEVRTARTVVRSHSTTININNGEIRADMDMSTGDLKDLTAPYSTAASAPSAALKGKVSGTLKDPVIEGQALVEGLRYENYELGRVKSGIVYSKNLLTLRDFLTADDGAGQSFEASGSIGFPLARELFELKNPDYNIALEARGAPLRRVADFFIKPGLPVGGTARVSLDIKGPSPVVTGRAALERPFYSDYAMDSAAFDLSYEKGLLRLSKGVMKKAASSLRLSGSLEGRKFSFEAASEKIIIADFLEGAGRKIKIPPGYAASLKASGKGSFDEPQVLVEGGFVGTAVKGAEDRTGPEGSYRAALSGKKLTVGLGLQGGKLKLSGEAALSREFPWSASLEIKPGRYDELISAFVKSVPPDFFLSMEGKGNFTGTRKNVNGTLRLSQFSLSAYGQRFAADKEVILALREGALSIDQFSMRGGQAAFSLSGAAGRKSLDVTLTGRTSLVPLKAFVGNIEDVSGTASYVLHAGGTWNKPRLSGGLSMADVNLSLKGMPQNIRITSAYLYVDEDRLVIQDLSGRVGGGEAGVTGVVYLDGFDIDRFYLDGLISNVNTHVKGFNLTLNGDLVYKGDKKSQNLIGELQAGRARYNERIDVASLAFSGKKPVQPSVAKGAALTTQLNVRVSSSDIAVSNNVVKATLSADLTLRGTAADPIPIGRVNTDRGKVYFRNTEFDIENASLIFSDPHRVNPVMNILATSSVKGYRVHVRLDGTVDRFNVALTSEPALDEASILSLITVGDFSTPGTAANKGVEGGVGAAQAGAFLTGKVQSVITDRMRNITGFDSINVEPGLSGQTGTVVPRITATKRLLNDKLYIIYSSGVGSQEQQIIKVEYALTDNISLIGLRDDLGSPGGDIQFRFQFR